MDESVGMDEEAPANRRLPRVTLLIAMRNEARRIGDTLAAIFAQDYPADRLEVLVADGRSTDGSVALVEELFRNRPGCAVFDNPERIQSCGWNLGIERARGDILGIVSAHCELAPDYVSRAVETLARTGGDLVGGPMNAVGGGVVGQAIALATTSPFGVGGARFHYTRTEEEVDTVYQGLCRRELYGRVGGFDPEMVRNQDDELSCRILAAGGTIVCNPRIRSRYHNRATLGTLARQYFQYGFWKVRLMQKHPRLMRPRHFAPPAVVAGAILLPLAGFLWHPLWYLAAALAALYLVAGLTATAALARKGRDRALWLVPLVFPVLHFCYGSGFLKGLLVWPWRGRPGRAPRLEMREPQPEEAP